MNGTLRLSNRPQGGLDASVRLAAQDCILLYLRRSWKTKPTILPLS